MKYVKLVSGIDYRGNGIRAVRGTPLCVEDAKADELVNTGFFEVCGRNEKPKDMESSGAAVNIDFEKAVSKMNGTELRRYAEVKGYDISDCTKVEEIRALVLKLDAGKPGQKEEMQDGE